MNVKIIQNTTWIELEKKNRQIYIIEYIKGNHDQISTELATWAILIGGPKKVISRKQPKLVCAGCCNQQRNTAALVYYL